MCFLQDIKILMDMGDLICLLYDIKHQIVCDCHLNILCATIVFSWDWESLIEHMVAHLPSILPFPQVLKQIGWSQFVYLESEPPFYTGKRRYMYIHVDSQVK